MRKREMSPDIDNRKNASALPDASAMEAEIRLISRFHSLTLFRAVLCVLLFAYQFLIVIFHIRTISNIIILLFLMLAPWLLEGVAAPYVKTGKAVLPYLRKQYHFTALRYVTNNITFLIACFLLLLWQRHQSGNIFPSLWIYYIPSILICTALALRILGPVLISCHIRRRLLSGQI